MKNLTLLRSSLLALAIFGMFLHIPALFQKAYSNLNLVRLNRSWLQVQFLGESERFLQDGVPDGWIVSKWGNSKGTYALVEDAFQGEKAVEINQTSKEGVLALAQDFSIEPNTKLVFRIQANGAGGAIQFQFRPNGESEWTAKGWRKISPSTNWTSYRIRVTVPAGMYEGRLLLRASGRVFFDDAFLGVSTDRSNRLNYLVNPSFEEDGNSGDLLGWWRKNVYVPEFPRINPQNTASPLAYQNVSDMMNGLDKAIKLRSESLEDCSLHPEMTSWLSALNGRFEQSGGVASAEHLYQLAIRLAPRCPQPYAALAGLYEQKYSYTNAAELYHRAAVLSGDSYLAGKYSFSEGLLHLRQTGNYLDAVRAFALAEEIQGWERGAWYRGAASFYLGQSLEALARNAEAISAYQRVLGCAPCSYYHDSAKEMLARLNGSVPQVNP